MLLFTILLICSFLSLSGLLLPPSVQEDEDDDGFVKPADYVDVIRVLESADANVISGGASSCTIPCCARLLCRKYQHVARVKKILGPMLMHPKFPLFTILASHLPLQHQFGTPSTCREIRSYKMPAHTHAQMRTCTRACRRAHTQASTETYQQTRTRTRARAHTHTHNTHTHTHILFATEA